MSGYSSIGGSFRDPAGFVFERDGSIYRQINSGYADCYAQLLDSGLYQRLVDENLLISHAEVSMTLAADANAFKVIQPERIAYLSYPYEWSFSQLKDAAMATLRIQQIALKFGLSLKDANGFNIQFHNGSPLLIDTLSFEPYEAGKPWVAYRQFCQHFLAPLLLVAYRDYRLVKLLRTNIDGIPLELASRLLPRRTWLKYSVLTHIHLHARAQQRFADAGESADEGQSSNSNAASEVKVSKQGLLGLLDGMTSLLESLRWQPGKTEWGDYYSATNYADAAMQQKEKLLATFLSRSKDERQDDGNSLVLDLGANTGRFSRVAISQGRTVIAQDIDEVAVEKNYLQCKVDKETAMLPLVQDLSNPSPALGWAHVERMSMLERGPVDTVLALALIHHLAIGNNTPLGQCAAFFAAACQILIIEFVPKTDSQVKRLLATREDVFPDYTREGFEAAFVKYFEQRDCQSIEGTERHLYLFKVKGR